MDHSQMLKQMLKFNKTALDNSFSAMTLVLEQNEKMANTFLDQANWVPEEGRKLIRDWMRSYRKGVDDFKKMTDESFEKVETFFEKSPSSAPGA